MNSLSRIIRYIFSAILVGGIIELLRFSVSSFERVPDRRRSPQPGPLPLFRDPVCGTFVAPEISVRAQRAGHTEHFCSEQCRDRYLNAPRQAARA